MKKILKVLSNNIVYVVVMGVLFIPSAALAKAGCFRGNESYKDLIELALGGGMEDLTRVTAYSVDWVTFSTSNFGHTRFKTIANTETDGKGMVTGVGRKIITKKKNIVLGGFFVEYANSDIETCTENIRGEGKSIQKGIGIMSRYNNRHGNYYEWLVHCGKANNRWGNAMGMSYEVAPTYYGGSLAFGHRFIVGKKGSLSPFVSYVYNHLDTEGYRTPRFDFDFEDVENHKSKLGVRYTMDIVRSKVVIRPYMVLTWEHEFDGKAVTHIKGFEDPEAPDVKGDTGSVEIGCKWEMNKWTVGTGVECFNGVRKGWNVTVAAIYNF